MRTLYNILFNAFFLISVPYYFLRMLRRGNWLPHFTQRFGRYDSKLKQAITNRHVLWMHAVSVGEVNVCTQLIRALEPRLPNLKIVVSTTTTTGMGELHRKLPNHISKIYYPIDRRPWVNRALGTIHPEAVVLVESEIWPNFLWRTQHMGIPTFLVNARLSERSFPRYRFFKFIFKPLFASFTRVGAQNEKDSDRLIQLGCRPEAIRVVGSLKFDAARIEERRVLDVAAIFRQLGFAADAQILVAGSTHAGEEALLADIFIRLRARFPSLRLVLVPRHFERGRDVGAQLKTRGVRFSYRNELTQSTQYQPGEIDCLLVNTTGELRYFYEQATIIFVGKSLSTKGGQNPIEPGALGKAMLFGPNMQNFAEIAAGFVNGNGAVQVQDAAQLEMELAKLLGAPDRRRELGTNALKVVHENLGAVGRTVEMIVEHLEGGSLYVAPRRAA